ncbi:TetR/AcrR family transcriptional regulator [uncultured Roseobacter sp.]|uniref:TetR/AcrR family transcriptional regulator n=1 Tax=uncultured Roseobacter sp. TaxID=114847 RepID=UPI002604AD71|nr:TetR/AcrR family transcriptional regulator [uncultured Roseobacter sp.]
MNTSPQNAARESYHHGDLRAQLLEATRQLVEEKGPDQFSVSEACRRAGVSTAAPYKHFKDKEEMLHHIAHAGMERQRQQMLDELALCEAGTLDRIVAMGRVYIRFALAEPGVFRLMFGLSEDHADHCDLVQLGDDTFCVVQSEVAKCHGRSEVIESDVNEAFLLWSFVHGLSFLLIDGKLKEAKVPFDMEITLLDIARRVVGPSGSEN